MPLLQTKKKNGKKKKITPHNTEFESCLESFAKNYLNESILNEFIYNQRLKQIL